MTKSYCTLPLLATALLAVGCLSTRTGSPVPAADPAALAANEKPIWLPSRVPAPLGKVSIVSGDPATVPLTGCIPATIKSATVESIGGIPDLKTSFSDPATLVITTRESDHGEAIIHLGLDDTFGSHHTVSLPVEVTQVARQHFRFKAAEGASKPATVCVAGSFNGWNMNANPLKEQPDGSFSGDIPMPPGKVTYKLVVDGNWILDPANDKTEDDGSGHTNSMLLIGKDGEKAKAPLDLSILPGNVPGMGPQGGFLATLPPGSQLDPKDVHIFLNNRELDPASYQVDGGRGLISLRVPGTEWGTEQFVTINATDVQGHTGTLVAPFDSSQAPRSPRDEVIYFAMTDRFLDGDPARNQPVKDEELVPLANYMGGDWAGIRSAVDSGYFDRLGVSTLWISPVNRQPSGAWADTLPPHRKFTGYHGYWPVSLTEANPEFGSLDDLRGLVSTSHQHGIAVLLDFVSNHFHQDSELFQQHPEYFSTVTLPDGTQNIRRFDQYPLTTWFDLFLADLDYDRNPALRDLMVTNAAYWLTVTGADGFRHDAVKHVPTGFWKALTEALHSDFTNGRGKRLYQVGETISSRGTINQYLGPELLDGQFDFPLLWAITDAFAQEKAGLETIDTAVRASIAEYPPGAIMSPLLGNHDVVRFMALADDDITDANKEQAKEIGYSNPPQVTDPARYNRLRLAFSLLMSVPGAPMIYYGDEYGMTGAADPDNRRMFVPESERTDSQKAITASLAEWAHARHDSVALRRGTWQTLLVNKERLIFARICPEEVVVVSLARHPDSDFAAVTLPFAWGTPASFEPLVRNGADALMDGTSLRITGGEYTAGAWRLKWNAAP